MQFATALNFTAVRNKFKISDKVKLIFVRSVEVRFH